MSFDAVVDFSLGEEGGYSNNLADPGGATNLGITQFTLNAFNREFPQFGYPVDVEHLTVEQAKNIYKLMYWDKLHCGELPDYLALVVFDAGINSKMLKVAQWLQNAVGVPADGVIGEKTIEAANRVAPVKALNEFHARRAYNFMLQDEIDDTFGLGWARRLMAVHNKALSIINPKAILT